MEKWKLALLYFPDSPAATGMRRLRRWIRNNRPLSQELERVGSNRNAKMYNKRELGLIYEYLGEP